MQTPREARSAFEAARQPLRRPPTNLRIEDRHVGAGLPVRTYVPLDGSPRAVFAYFHGGGFVTGDLDSHDHVACALATGTQSAVVNVDYRLLPDHRFPAAFEDAVTALRWLAVWADSLGVPATRLGAGGDSSGANLAVAAALELRDELRLRALWLAYPFLGADFATSSHLENARAPMLTSAKCERIMADYVGRPLSSNDWRAAPLLMQDLAGLPPVVAIAAELDPLRSDAEILVSRLGAGSVLVEARGMPHGFLRWIPDCKPCMDVLNVSIAKMRGMLSD